MRTCSTCQFWEAYSDEGECHRHPPAVMSGGAFSREGASFPRTHNADWCGEHKAGPKFLYSKEPA